ncbi:MAG: sigma-70 family RNA polymerase sigma factor [Planctomycetaceae bacterium]|nr:sigma-70 family RNA polymerase sigma factor [Planctomycetaceae bacterium]
MSNAEDPPAIDITQLLQRLEEGDGEAAKELFPIVYDELRQLARLRLSEEKVGHTLQPTALVNEVYLRLIGQRDTVRYASRRGLMVAAAEAMRHILVDSARRRLAQRRGGNVRREHLDVDGLLLERPDEVLDVHDAIEALALADAAAAEIVKLHYFAGYSLAEIAELQGLSRATVNRRWVYARAWLKTHIESQK